MEILVKMKVHEQCKSEQFQILALCSYLQFMNVSYQKDVIEKYLLLLFSKKGLKEESYFDPVIYFTASLPDYLNFNILYFCESYDAAYSHKFSFSIPLHKCFISTYTQNGITNILIEHNQYKFYIYGENQNQTDEFHSSLKFSLHSFKQHEKSITNDKLNTFDILRSEAKFKNKEFPDIIKEKFSEIFISGKKWFNINRENINLFFIDVNKAQSYLFNLLESMLCTSENFDINLYITISSEIVLHIMTRMEQYWENKNESRPPEITTSDIYRFIEYLKEFNIKLNQYNILDEKIIVSFSNLFISSINQLSKEVILGLDPLINLQINLVAEVQRFSDILYQFLYPDELNERIKSFLTECNDKFLSNSKHDKKSETNRAILKNIVQKSLKIINEYISKIELAASKEDFDNSSGNQHLISIINLDKNLKTTVKSVINFANSYSDILDSDKVEDILGKSAIYDSIRKLRKTFEAKYIKNKFDELIKTKLIGRIDEINIQTFITGTLNLLGELNHHLNKQNSQYLKMSLFKELIEHYTVLSIITIKQDKQNRTPQIFVKIESDIKNLEDKLQSPYSNFIFDSYISLRNLYNETKDEILFTASRKLLKITKEKVPIFMRYVKKILRMRTDAKKINLKEMMKKIQDNLEMKDENLIQVKEKPLVPFSLTKLFEPEKYQLKDNKIKINIEKPFKFLFAVLIKHKSVLGHSFHSWFKKTYFCKLTYETINFYVKENDLTPKKFIYFHDIKEIKVNIDIFQFVLIRKSERETWLEGHNKEEAQEWVDEINKRIELLTLNKPKKWRDSITFLIEKNSNQEHFEIIN